MEYLCDSSKVHVPNASKAKHQFEVRKGLLIKKEPNKKLGDIVLPQVHLKKSTDFRLPFCPGKATWEGQEVTDTSDILDQQGSQEDCAS